MRSTIVVSLLVTGWALLSREETKLSLKMTRADLVWNQNR